MSTVRMSRKQRNPAGPSAPAGSRWLPPLLVVSTGIVALLSANPAPRATAPEDRNPTTQTDPLTAEDLTTEAKDIAARVLEAFPEDPDAHALVGRLRYLHGEVNEARRSWERCLKLDPQRADIYRALAEAAWEQGDFEKTAQACRQALQIDPTMRGVRLRLGRSLLELGRTVEAVAVLEQAVSLSGTGHYYLAQAYMQSEAYEKARDSYLRAVDLHPDNAQAYYGLAQASIRLGQPERARQYQEAFRKHGLEDAEAVKARKRRPKQLSGLGRERSITANACIRAAEIYRDHGSLQQAEQLWKRAAILDPRSPSRDDLVALYDRSGRLEEARTFFEQLTHVWPDNSLDHLYLGNICARLNRREEAEQAYLNVTRHAPDQPEGYEALGRLYLTTGWKISEAKPFAARAAQLRPSPRTYLLLAQICRKIGERDEAMTALEQALKMDPGNVACRRLYDELREPE